MRSIPIILRVILCACLCAGLGRAQTSVTFDSSGNLATQVGSPTPAAPVITAQPTTQLGQVGGFASFSVVASGNGLTYQWYENNAPINGANGATFLISNAQTGSFTNQTTGTNSYYVIVTNSVTSVTSNTVALYLDTNSSGMPDWWQIQYFGATGVSPNGDADGDGVTNQQEYLDGTDPTNAASHDYVLTVSGPVVVQPNLSRYPPGTTVTLTATSSANGYFECWTGAVTGTAPVQTLVMNADATVAAITSTAITPSTAPILSSGGVNQASVNSVLQLSNGQFMVSGIFETLNGRPQWDVGRLNSNGSLDATYFPGAGNVLPVSSNGANAMAQQSDGKTLLVGFSSTAGNSEFHPATSIYRINTDGTLDTSFVASAPAYIENSSNGQANIYAVAVLPNGQILIGGDFATINGVAEAGIARLNSDGSLDTTFNSGGAGLNGYNDYSKVEAIQVASSGLIYIAGNFSSFNGTSVASVARLNTNGTLDTTFDATAVFDGNNTTLYCLLIRSNGAILVGGDTYGAGGTSLNGIVGLTSSGALDSSFNLAQYLPANCLVALSNGQILAAGYSSVVRLNSNGTTDSSFATVNVGGSSIIQTMAVVASTGQILVGGNFSTAGNIAHGNLVFLNSDGSLNNNVTMNTGLADSGSYPTCLAEQSDGKVLVGGNFSLLDNVNVSYLARLNYDSSIDTTFNAGGAGPDSSIVAVLPIPGGKTFIAGNLTHYNGTPAQAYARLNADGTLDTTFAVGNTTSSQSATAAVLQPDGKIIVGGTFQNSTVHLQRLNTDGTLDTTFTSALNGAALCETLQPDGKLLVGGYFTTVHGVSAPRLVRLNTDGSLDTTFAPPASITAASVGSIALLPSGQILVSSGGNAVMRLNADGSLDSTYLNLVTTSDVYPNGISAIAALPDGSAIVGGNSFVFAGAPPQVYFTTALQQISQYMVKLQPNGAIDTSFEPNVNAAPSAILVRSNGEVYAAGPFTTDAAQNAVGLVRYSPAPTLQLSLVSVSTPSPVGPGTMETLTATDSSLTTTLEDVFFQDSTDGVNFTNIGQATSAGNNQWTVSWTPSVAGTYYLRTLATDESQITGASVATFNFAVTAALAAPEITTQPQSQSIALGGTANFSVIASGGGLTYQWLYDTTPLIGQTSSTLTLSNLTLPQSGNYSVVVSNSINSVTSSTAVLSVQASYGSWASSYGVSPSNSATPQNDGVGNLLKYAFAINPTRAMTPSDNAALPHVSTVINNSQEYLTLTFREYSDAAANGVAITLQSSPDLVNWSDVPSNEIFSQSMGYDPTTGDQIMQMGVPVSGTGAKQFIRLQVSGP